MKQNVSTYRSQIILKQDKARLSFVTYQYMYMDIFEMRSYI